MEKEQEQEKEKPTHIFQDKISVLVVVLLIILVVVGIIYTVLFYNHINLLQTDPCTLCTNSLDIHFPFG